MLSAAAGGIIVGVVSRCTERTERDGQGFDASVGLLATASNV